VRGSAHPEANIIFGAVIDPDMKEDVQMTVIATGFDRMKSEEPTLGNFNQRGYEPQRSYESRPIPSRPEPVKVPNDYLVRTFDREDLDIPAFLRRRTNGNK